jgi:hypothetical protein
MNNKQKITGLNPMPSVNSKARELHMKLIHNFIQDKIGLKNRVTSGKLNASGRHIMKPDWTTGYLEYEPNPDAAIHEVAHVFLAPMGMSLTDIQRDMDQQFGFVQSQYGYMKQKRTEFEVIPMAMEQKIRRMIGLPASTKFVKVNDGDAPRITVDTKIECAVRVGNKDLIRCSKNLPKGALKRLNDIQNGIIKFDITKGWFYSNDINAKINKKVG